MLHQKQILNESPLQSVFHAIKCRAIDARRRNASRVRREVRMHSGSQVVLALRAIPIPDDPQKAQDLINDLKVIATDCLSEGVNLQEF